MTMGTTVRIPVTAKAFNCAAVHFLAVYNLQCQKRPVPLIQCLCGVGGSKSLQSSFFLLISYIISPPWYKWNKQQTKQTKGFGPQSCDIEIWVVQPASSALDFRMNLRKASEVLIPTTNTSSCNTKISYNRCFRSLPHFQLAAIFSDCMFARASNSSA